MGTCVISVGVFLVCEKKKKIPLFHAKRENTNTTHNTSERKRKKTTQTKQTDD